MSGHDAGFEGRGFVLFEHWENNGKSLLVVTSDRTSIGPLEPGDTIVKRRWAAAGEPEVFNEARGAAQ